MYDIYDNDFDRKFDEAVEAIEKKEHRLIWADALKRHYAWWRDGGKDNNFFYELADNFDTIVDLQPTVEAALVRHGHWIVRPVADWGASNTRCSACGYEDFQPMVLKGVVHNYCPDCGAIMDESEA